MNVFDLIRLLTFAITTVCLAFTAFTKGGFVLGIACLPLCVAVGYAMPYAVLFMLAVVLKIWLGGPLFSPKTPNMDSDRIVDQNDG